MLDVGEETKIGLKYHEEQKKNDKFANDIQAGNAHSGKDSIGKPRDRAQHGEAQDGSTTDLCDDPGLTIWGEASGRGSV